MISGKLPNNTVWWLSTDREKIWIESGDLEQEKFKEKGFNISYDRLFYGKSEVGELTTSRLESRKRKDAWIIKLEPILSVYPELDNEIRKKDIEEKKKKDVTKIKSGFKKAIISKDLPKRKIPIEQKDHFDINRPYVVWIKDEVTKSEKGSIIISLKELKSKMGAEFESMNDFRIYYGLNKILSAIGISVELSARKIENNKKESVAIIRKTAIL